MSDGEGCLEWERNINVYIPLFSLGLVSADFVVSVYCMVWSVGLLCICNLSLSFFGVPGLFGPLVCFLFLLTHTGR